MEGMVRPPLQRVFMLLSARQKAEAIDRNVVKSES
jgi:hypothetical protein